jgi:hypothetical protein
MMRTEARPAAKMILICRSSITPNLLVQREFEDDDGGVCYIETHDHDTYSGHFRLRLIEVTPTRLAFDIASVEVTYDLDAKRFDEMRRIAHIIFGVS